MAKILVDCENPNDLNSLNAAIEKHFGKCNVTYAEQAKAMKEAGLVESRREAARKIAKETGETPKAVEHRIDRGEKGLPHVGATGPTPPTSSQSHGNKENKGHTQDGKPRQRAPGAGRKPKYEVTEAMDIIVMAISQLERIRKDDPKRLAAFETVINWINTNK